MLSFRRCGPGPEGLADRAPEERLLFLKAWNEWAEGNYVEPDREHGHAYLDVIREVMFEG